MRYSLPNIWPFASVIALPLPNNKVKLQWVIDATFIGEKPWKFQPQVNYYGGDPDQWEDLGPEVTDVFEIEADITIPVVKTVLPFYRVKFSFGGSSTTYTSDIAVSLPISLQLAMQKIIRNVTLQKRSSPVRRGILLKKKMNGTECSDCVDELTKQATKSDCEICYGVGIVGGYWVQDNPNVIFLSEYQSISDVSNLGHIDPIKRACMFVGLPVPMVGDIWVDTTTNRRYVVRETANAGMIFDVPIVTKATLGLLASGDIAYKIEV